MSAPSTPGRQSETDLGAVPVADDLTRAVHVLRTYTVQDCRPPLLSPATMAALGVLIDTAAHSAAAGRSYAGHEADRLPEACHRLARALLSDLDPHVGSARPGSERFTRGLTVQIESQR